MLQPPTLPTKPPAPTEQTRERILQKLLLPVLRHNLSVPCCEHLLLSGTPREIRVQTSRLLHELRGSDLFPVRLQHVKASPGLTVGKFWHFILNDTAIACRPDHPDVASQIMDVYAPQAVRLSDPTMDANEFKHRSLDALMAARCALECKLVFVGFNLRSAAPWGQDNDHELRHTLQNNNNFMFVFTDMPDTEHDEHLTGPVFRSSLRPVQL